MVGYFKRMIRYLKYKMYYRPKMLYQKHLNTLYGVQSNYNYNNDEYYIPQENTSIWFFNNSIVNFLIDENRNNNNYASVPFMVLFLFTEGF